MADTNQIILNQLKLEGCLVFVMYFEDEDSDEKKISDRIQRDELPKSPINNNNNSSENTIDNSEKTNKTTTESETKTKIKSTQSILEKAASKNSEKFIWKEAEILSTKSYNNNFYSYVHYTGWNKRLDEWVTRDRLDLSTLRKKEKKEENDGHSNSSSQKKKSQKSQKKSSSHKKLTANNNINNSSSIRENKDNKNKASIGSEIPGSSSDSRKRLVQGFDEVQSSEKKIKADVVEEKDVQSSQKGSFKGLGENTFYRSVYFCFNTLKLIQIYSTQKTENIKNEIYY